MGGILIFSMVTISLALVFYTIGVWSERKAKVLRKRHVVILWLGLLSDITGTLCMVKIAKSGISDVTELTSAIHGITGATAIILIAFHVVWATIVLGKNDGKKNQTFHRFSLIVWIIWLIPYLVGMIMGMK